MIQTILLSCDNRVYIYTYIHTLPNIRAGTSTLPVYSEHITILRSIYDDDDFSDIYEAYIQWKSYETLLRVAFSFYRGVRCDRYSI